MAVSRGRASLLAVVALLVLSVQAKVEVIDVDCANSSATDSVVKNACGGMYTVTLMNTSSAMAPGVSYKLNMAVSTMGPYMLLSELQTSPITSKTLTAADLPATDGATVKLNLTGTLPTLTSCGMAYVVVAVIAGTTVSQQAVPWTLPCTGEDVDLKWTFPAAGSDASVRVTTGQNITSKLVLTLTNAGSTALSQRMALDAPEVKVILAQEGTLPFNLTEQAKNMTLEKMSQNILMNLDHLLFNNAPDAILLMNPVQGAETLLLADDLKSGRALAAGGTVSLPLSRLSASKDASFNEIGYPGAIILILDPFNKTKDSNRSNNVIALLANFTDSATQDADGGHKGPGSWMDGCQVVPSVEDDGQSALVVSLQAMPYMYDGDKGGFRKAKDTETKMNMMRSLESRQVAARLKAIGRCTEALLNAAGDDPAADIANSQLSKMSKLLTSINMGLAALKPQITNQMAKDSHNKTMLMLDAAQQMLSTALNGDDKAKAFILQMLTFKLKVHMMGPMMFGGPIDGGPFGGPRDGPPGGSWGGPPGGSWGGPPGDSWGGPPGGSWGGPPGDSWGGPPGDSWGGPPGDSWGGPPGDRWGGPPGDSWGGPPGGSWGGPPGGSWDGQPSNIWRGQTGGPMQWPSSGPGGSSWEGENGYSGPPSDPSSDWAAGSGDDDSNFPWPPGSSSGSVGIRASFGASGHNPTSSSMSARTSASASNAISGSVNTGFSVSSVNGASSPTTAATWGEQANGSFLCANGQLTKTKYAACDGYPDCTDSSDEQNCGFGTAALRTGGAGRRKRDSSTEDNSSENRQRNDQASSDTSTEDNAPKNRQRNSQQSSSQQRNSQQRNGQERKGQQRNGQERKGQQRNGQPRSSQLRNDQSSSETSTEDNSSEDRQRNGRQRNGQQGNGRQRNGQPGNDRQRQRNPLTRMNSVNDDSMEGSPENSTEDNSPENRSIEDNSSEDSVEDRAEAAPRNRQRNRNRDRNGGRRNREKVDPETRNNAPGGTDPAVDDGLTEMASGMLADLMTGSISAKKTRGNILKMLDSSRDENGNLPQELNDVIDLEKLDALVKQEKQASKKNGKKKTAASRSYASSVRYDGMSYEGFDIGDDDDGGSRPGGGWSRGGDDDDDDRYGSGWPHGGGGGRSRGPGGRRHRGRGRPGSKDGSCDALSKEAREMNEVTSKLFMRLMISTPEEMKEFSFLPLSLLRSLKSLVTDVIATEPPQICAPWKEAAQNNTVLQFLPLVLMDIAGWYTEPTVDSMMLVLNYVRQNVSQAVRDYHKGNVDMLALLDLSLLYMNVIEKNMTQIVDLVAPGFDRFNDNYDKMAAFRGKPGREPSMDARCDRLARATVNAAHSTSAQTGQGPKESTIFESPLAMIREADDDDDARAPVYWTVEKKHVLRGTRCLLTGAMMWDKVAVCSCKGSSAFPDHTHGRPRGPKPGGLDFDPTRVGQAFGPLTPGMVGRPGGPDMNQGPYDSRGPGMTGSPPMPGLPGGSGGAFSPGGSYMPGGQTYGPPAPPAFNPYGNNTVMPSFPMSNSSGARPLLPPQIPLNFGNITGSSQINISDIADQVRSLITNSDGSINQDAIQNILKNAGGLNFSPFRARESHSGSGQTVELNSLEGDPALDWAQIAATSHVELVMRSEEVLSGNRLQVSGKVLVVRQRTDSKKIEFGTICDDGWGEEEARVVCGVVANRLRQPLIRASPSATFQEPTEGAKAGVIDNATIKLDGVQCQGDEEDILECKHDGWGVHNCAGHEAAFVTCIMQ